VRFRRQLAIGYTALLTVLLLTGVAAVLALRVTTDRLEHVAHDLGADLSAIQRLRYQAESAVAASRRYLLTGDETSAERFTRAVQRLDATIADLDSRGGELVTGMSEVHSVVRNYVDMARAVMAQRSTTHDAQEIETLFEARVAPARDHLETTIADFVARERAACDSESSRADQLADRMQGVVVLATAAGVMISIGLAWLWIRRLGARYALEREATDTARNALAARDEMLAIVSHDLRNPLTTVEVGASLLQMDDRASPTSIRHIGMIGEAARRMEHLIDELLDVAKLDAGKLEVRPEPCEVRSLFEATESLFEARAVQAGITLVVESPADLVVSADRERILQVLSNLVGNAFKYTPRGGRITLALRGHRICVSDTGPGIAPDAQPHVFERYWQARARGRGSLGLGLYICQQLVEAHHGRIGVESVPGHGSTFWFELPTCPEARVARAS
jgi:signal transduction histidine kinase